MSDLLGTSTLQQKLNLKTNQSEFKNKKHTSYKQSDIFII